LSSANQTSELNRQRQREIEEAMKADFEAAGSAFGRQELIEGVFERKMKLETSRPDEQSDPFAVESHPLSLSVDEVLQAEMRAAKVLVSLESPDPAEKSKIAGSVIVNPRGTGSGPSSTPIPAALSIDQVLQAEMEAAKTLQSTETPLAAAKANTAGVDPFNLVRGGIKSEETLSAPNQEGLRAKLGSLSVDEILQAEMRAAKDLLSIESLDPAEKSKMEGSTFVNPHGTSISPSSTAIPSPLSIDQVLQAEMEAAKALKASETPPEAAKIEAAGANVLNIVSLVDLGGTDGQPSLSTMSEEALQAKMESDMTLQSSDAKIGKKAVRSPVDRSPSNNPTGETPINDQSVQQSTETQSSMAESALATPYLDAKISLEVDDEVKVNSTPVKLAGPPNERTGASKSKGDRQRRRKRQNRKGNQNNNKTKNNKGSSGDDGI
jgi:hypothetical protein